MSKQVVLPLEEYNELLQDREDKQSLLDEIDKESDERGYLVRYITHMWRRENSAFFPEYNFVREKSTVEIQSKDEVLAKAQEEINRLTDVCDQLNIKIKYLKKENESLLNRGLLDRIFNKHTYD